MRKRSWLKNPLVFIIVIFVSLFSQSAGTFTASAGNGALLFSCEQKKIFIIGSHDEGESILFNLIMKNSTDNTLTIEKLFIGFKTKGKLLLKKEQPESFFKQGTILRDRKFQPQSTIKWSAVCLTSESFGPVDEIEFTFGLKARGRSRTTQSFQIPVSRYLQKTPLRVPFKGLWKVTQGHACRSNHRISGYGGDFAFDFAALGPTGNIAEDLYSKSYENKYAYGFGKEVIAPASGKIVKVTRDAPDNEGTQDYPRKSIDYEAEHPFWVFGNFIIIDHQNGEYSLLAHMKNGSITVKEGDTVNTGELIGRCGNSGNTPFPHLHYQLMDGDDPEQYNVSGLPASFSNYTVLIPPSQFSDDLEPRDLLLKKETITSGSPEQGMIIQGD